MELSKILGTLDWTAEVLKLSKYYARITGGRQGVDHITKHLVCNKRWNG